MRKVINDRIEGKDAFLGGGLDALMKLRNYMATSDFTNSQSFRIHFWMKDQEWLRKEDISRIFFPMSLKVWHYTYATINHYEMKRNCQARAKAIVTMEYLLFLE